MHSSPSRSCSRQLLTVTRHIHAWTRPARVGGPAGRVSLLELPAVDKRPGQQVPTRSDRNALSCRCGLGRPPAQVALAWLLGRAGVTAPVVGVTKAAHLEDALAALDVGLGPGECARLEVAYVPHPVAGPE